MNTHPRLAGAVASTRSMGTLTLLVGMVGSLPVAFGNTGGLGTVAAVLLATALFATPFLWFVGPRRAWFQARLDQITPAPQGAPVTAREATFEAVSRNMAAPLLIGLGIGLFSAYRFGVPAGLSLVGTGSGMLCQAQWLARQERKLATWLVTPLVPFQPRADDPALPTYLKMPFYSVSDQ